MKAIVVAPMHHPLRIHQAITEFSPEFSRLRATLRESSGLHAQYQQQCITATDASTKYQDVSLDDQDIRLFIWQPDIDSTDLCIHFFNNEIAIAELSVDVPDDLCDAKSVEVWLTQYCYSKLKGLKERFNQALKEKGDFPEGVKLADVENTKAFIPEWLGKFLFIDRGELESEESQQLVRLWLKDTIRPEDAEDIISGKINDSLRWLKYIVTGTPESNRHKIEAMILAQYFYTFQDLINRELFDECPSVFSAKISKSKEEMMRNSRSKAELQIGIYKELKKYLTRKKKYTLEHILEQWEFPELIDNTSRMASIYSKKIQDIANTKRQRALKYTDYILISIGLFSIFDLVLSAIIVSRTLATNPALQYTDSGGSIFISWFASANLDIAIAISLATVISIIMVYFYVKGD